MSKIIVGVDSDYEEIVQKVAEHRRLNVYPYLRKAGFTVDDHQGNLATRKYLQKALSKTGVVFFTGSGHGLENQLIGNDRQAILQVGKYKAGEAQDKIIHLLACFTAFELGARLIADGCKAFFGYDIFFTFYPGYEDEFFSPDAEIDRAIVEGATAREVHERAIAVYDAQIAKLKKLGVHPAIVADMQINKDHLCSPVKSAKYWGDPQARLG